MRRAFKAKHYEKSKAKAKPKARARRIE